MSTTREGNTSDVWNLNPLTINTICVLGALIIGWMVHSSMHLSVEEVQRKAIEVTIIFYAAAIIIALATSNTSPPVIRLSEIAKVTVITAVIGATVLALAILVIEESMGRNPTMPSLVVGGVLFGEFLGSMLVGLISLWCYLKRIHQRLLAISRT